MKTIIWLFALICLAAAPEGINEPPASEVYKAQLAQLTLASSQGDSSSDMIAGEIATIQKQLDTLKQLENRSQVLKNRPEALEAESAAIKDLLAKPVSPTSINTPAPDESDSAALSAKQQEIQLELNQVEATLTKLHDEQKNMGQRIGKLSNELAAAHSALEEAMLKHSTAPNPLQALSIEISMASTKLNIANMEIEQQLFPKEMRLYRDKINLNINMRKTLSAQNANIIKQIENLRLLEAAAFNEEVKEFVSQLQPANKNIETGSKRLLALAARRLEDNSVLRNFLALQNREHQRSAELTALSEKQQRIIKQVDAMGLTPAIGFVLRQERQTLPDTRELKDEIKARNKEMAALQLKLVELEEEKHQLSYNLQLDEGVPQEAELKEKLERAIKLCRHDYFSYFREIAKLEAINRQLIEKTVAITKYIDERVYWIPNSGPFTNINKTAINGAFNFFLSPGQWLPVLKNYKNYLPWIIIWPAAILLALIGYWTLVRRRLKAAWQKNITNLKEAGKKPTTPEQNESNIHFIRSLLKAFLMMPVLAIPKPLIFLTIAAGCYSLSRDSAFFFALTRGFINAAVVFYIFGIIHLFLESHGLYIFAVHWAETTWQKESRAATILQYVLAFLTFICTGLAYQPSDVLINSVGRFTFMLILLSCFIWLIGMGKKPWQTAYRGWLKLLYNIILAAIYLMPPALIVFTFMGYYFTAIPLAIKFLFQLLTLVSIVILANITKKTIKIRLGMKQSAKNREAMLVRLVHAISAILALLSLYLIWSDVLPALNAAGSVTLWTTTSGNTLHNVSLGDGLTALIIAILVILLARNLRTILSLVGFDKLPFDAGIRNALATLIRYAVILIGGGSACTILGLSWNNIQWLVAAMSVGLGFGLQEIFANFVSGIIILFERPVRPGDTVTIGDISGEVTKINIRATTIKDWDNKEMIVPNKEFITGRILNWTGSDSIQRVVISVGVAYGSDLQKVQEILLKIAADCPLVLKKPAPSVIFSDFGDSALDFKLRLYTDISTLAKAQHEVRLAIDKAFNEAGISIPFPQRDVHLIPQE